jgi:hypothetical protein
VSGYPLAPSLFPHLDWIDPDVRRGWQEIPLGGTAGLAPYRRGPLFALEVWVAGGTFHQYGRTSFDLALERFGSPSEAVAEMALTKARLKLSANLAQGQRGMSWSLDYQRYGDPDAWGASSGYGSLDDIVYGALSLIEQHERQVYEESLVLGVA